ncbi:MAG: sensor histidine kinase [Gemmatimonadales bacterium]|nr:MAG: sensor histidine kinase [Gemmatimonadales bacterium]
MRLVTRMGLGIGLLAALMAGTVAWQMSTIRTLEVVTEDLAETSLEAARVSIRLLQALEGVSEFSAKATVLADPDYRAQWDTWESAAESELARLSALGLEGESGAELTRMLAAWEDYLEAARPLRPLPDADASDPLPPPLDADAPEALDRVSARLEGLRNRTDRLVTLVEAEVRDRTSEAREAARQAGDVSRIAAAGGIVLALLTWLLLWRSISPRLRRLTGGTRELAQGRFEHRIPDRGSDELALLARDFNLMARKLGELDELKKDFVSHVSHELKSPLAAIQETVKALQDEVAGPLTERQARLLGHARGSADRLGTMIGNLLTASRLEAGGESWDPVVHDVERIVRQVLAETEPVAAERDVRVAVRVRTRETEALCDGSGLRDVVTNLLTNALKFTAPGTRVEVSLNRTPTLPDSMPAGERTAMGTAPGPFLLLEVVDEGPGIPEAHREAIFRKFHQIQGGERRIDGQGVGLGLAITRRIVRAHQGAVWVESVDSGSGGARFRVLLPVTPPDWAHLAGPEGPDAG